MRPLVSIICLTDDIYCIGPRRISSQLKRHGFDVRLVFLQAQSLWGQISQRFRSHFEMPAFSESLYRELISICDGSLVVGLSVWTHQADEAELITRRLQRDLKSKIIWGGIHPTSFPENCIGQVEGICLGEGDVSFLRLAEALRDGREYKTIPGFWFRDGDRIIKNREEPLVEDLDELPFLDFEFQDHFVNDQGRLKRMDMALMKKYYGGKLWTMFSHGCPYKCTFCSNDLLIDLQDGYRKFRHHTPEFFIAEVRYILSKYPHIYNIVIDDDAYMFLPLPLIRDFAAKYRQNLDIPFFVSGVIPASVENKKFKVLIDAGMIKMRIGIQSGNRHMMKDVFMRPLHDQKIFLAAEMAYQNRKHLAPVQYDLIVDNPWENPEELKDTVRLVHQLKPPYTFAINSLTLLPGTTIYKMGKEAGFTDDGKKITLASYVHFMPTLLNLTLAFYNITRVPDFWFRYVMRKKFGQRTVTMPQHRLLGTLVTACGLVKKLIHSSLRRDISPMPRPLDRWVGKLLVRKQILNRHDPNSKEYRFKFALPVRPVRPNPTPLETAADPVQRVSELV